MTRDSSSGDTENVSTAVLEYRNHPEVAGEATRPLSDIVDVAVSENAGLTLTEQRMDSATLTLTGHEPVTVLWRNLVKNREIQRHFIIAARNAVATRGRHEFDLLLDAMGIADTPVMNHDPREMMHRLRHRPARAKKKAGILLNIIQELGTGVSTTDDVFAMAMVFQFAYEGHLDDIADVETPVVNIEIECTSFKSLGREQRSDICKLLCTLSKALDVRLVADRVTQAYLRNSHRDELSCVSEWENTRIIDSRVDEALMGLEPDGTAVAILRALRNDSSESLQYNSLYASLSVSKSRVRQCIATLDEYGLVDRYGPPQAKKVEIIGAGKEVLDAFAR